MLWPCSHSPAPPPLHRWSAWRTISSISASTASVSYCGSHAPCSASSTVCRAPQPCCRPTKTQVVRLCPPRPSTTHLRFLSLLLAPEVLSDQPPSAACLLALLQVGIFGLNLLQPQLDQWGSLPRCCGDPRVWARCLPIQLGLEEVMKEEGRHRPCLGSSQSDEGHSPAIGECEEEEGQAEGWAAVLPLGTSPRWHKLS